MSMGADDQQIFVNGEFVSLTSDMHEFVKLEAERLLITEAEAYERVQAEEDAGVKHTISNERLLKIAELNPPPQEWFEQDEEDLFG